jgi:FkbM family methyltransferase
MIFWRPKTADPFVYDEVIKYGHYKIPPNLGGQVVVDIGCHIGLYSLVCLNRGAKFIAAYEAHPQNFRLACTNLRSCTAKGRLSLNHAVVWRSDEPESSEIKVPDYDTTNTGGISVVWHDSGTPVKTVSLDGVIRQAMEVNRTDKVDMLKIDCEGSEYPILYTSKLLGHVKRIAGEWHKIKGAYNPRADVPGLSPDPVALNDYLKSTGFATTIWSCPGTDEVGMFFAERQ